VTLGTYREYSGRLRKFIGRKEERNNKRVD
jgi:hypothetical protein